MKGKDAQYDLGYSFRPDFYGQHEIIFIALIQQNKVYQKHWGTEGII